PLDFHSGLLLVLIPRQRENQTATIRTAPRDCKNVTRTPSSPHLHVLSFFARQTLVGPASTCSNAGSQSWLTSTTNSCSERRPGNDNQVSRGVPLPSVGECACALRRGR